MKNLLEYSKFHPSIDLTMFGIIIAEYRINTSHAFINNKSFVDSLIDKPFKTSWALATDKLLTSWLSTCPIISSFNSELFCSNKAICSNF